MVTMAATMARSSGIDMILVLMGSGGFLRASVRGREPWRDTGWPREFFDIGVWWLVMADSP
jgi:hypothetical protein